MGIRISSLTPNALPYTGSEKIPLVQSNETRAGTLSSFVNYLSGDFAFIDKSNNFVGNQTIQGNLSVLGTLSATMVEAISAKFTYIDIKQYELSGFDIKGDFNVVGKLSATGDVTIGGGLTALSAVFFDVNSNSPAVEIIQRGSGHSLLVRDIQGDTTPLVITGEGNLGVGTITPNEALTVNGNISSNGVGVFDTSSNQPALRVTQRGNGAAIRVEDSHTADSTPFIVTSDGNVGIGVATPNETLTVVGNVSSTGGMTIVGGITGTSPLILDTSTSSPVLEITQRGSGPVVIIKDVFSDTTPFAIASDGKVGIGTLTPNESLTVFGNLSVSGTLSATMIEAISSRVTYLDIREYELSGFRATGPVIIESNSSDTTLRITQSGTGDVIRVEDELNPDASPFIINNSGSVGIGTSTPSEKLTVVGNISASGNLSATNIVSVGGAIRPTAGNTSNDGIKFPDNPGGGGGDSAWIRYYSRVGASHNFEIGTNNDSDDNIVLLPSGSVGIGLSSPNEKLTVSGNISATGNIHSLSVISTPTSDSTKWGNAYTNVNSNSANWQRGYTAFNGMTSLSANWQNTFTTMTANSASWNTVYSTVNANSATTWNYQGTDLKNLSSGWVGGNSVYTTVNANSATTWNYQGTDLKNLSSGWVGGNSVYTTVNANSASWNTVYTTVCAQSANWNRSTILNVSNTTVLLALSDSYDYIRLTNASPITIQIPILSWNMGTEITFRRTTSAGAITLSAGVGVTINDDGSASVLAGDTFILKYISSNTWDFI